MSASSTASSSSSRSSSPEGVQAFSSSPSALVPRPNNNSSNTSRYIPPLNYRPASFPSSTALNHTDLQSSLSTTHQSNSSNSSSKQIWIIKIPDGVHPAQLDGLKVSIPTSGGDGGPTGSDKALATLTTKRRDGKDSGKEIIEDTYELFASSATDPDHLPADARNSQAGMKKAKAKQSGDKSQLADQSQSLMGPVEDHDRKQGFAGHMRGLRAYLPVGGSKEGLVTAAPLPITQYLEFVMVPPLLKKEADNAPSGTHESHKVARKLRSLSGFFAPSGYLYNEDAASSATPSSTLLTSTSTSTHTAGQSERKRKQAEMGDQRSADESPDGSLKKKGKREKALQGH